MAARIAAFVITLLTSIVIGVSIFTVMVMAMNGYNESDAKYGIITFGILAFAVSLLMATLAAFAAGRLIKRGFNPIIGTLVAIIVFSIAGAILKGVCCIIGIGVSELVRVNF